MARAGLRRGSVLGLSTKLRLIAAGMTMLVVAAALTTWFAYSDMSRVFFRVANEHVASQYLIAGINDEAGRLVEEIGRIHRADPLTLSDQEIEALSAREASLEKRLNDLEKLAPGDPLIDELSAAVSDHVAAAQSYSTLRRSKTETEIRLAELADLIDPRFTRFETAIVALEDGPSIDLLADIRSTFKSAEESSALNDALPAIIWRNIAALRAIAEARGHAALIRTTLMSAVDAPDIASVDRLEAEFEGSVEALQRIWNREAGRAMARLVPEARPLLALGDPSEGVFGLRRSGLERVDLIDSLNQAVLTGTPRIRQGVSALVLQSRQQVEDATISTHNNLNLKAALLGVFIILSIVLSLFFGWWYVGRRLGRRLTTLRQGAEEIATGNYGRVLDERGGDELAVLSHALNELARRSNDLAHAEHEIERLRRATNTGEAEVESYLLRSLTIDARIGVAGREGSTAAQRQTRRVGANGKGRNSIALKPIANLAVEQYVSRANDLRTLSSGELTLDEAEISLDEFLEQIISDTPTAPNRLVTAKRDNTPAQPNGGLSEREVSGGVRGDVSRLAGAIADCIALVQWHVDDMSAELRVSVSATPASGILFRVETGADRSMNPHPDQQQLPIAPSITLDDRALSYAHHILAAHGGSIAVPDVGPIDTGVSSLTSDTADGWRAALMLSLPGHRYIRPSTLGTSRRALSAAE